MNYKVLYRKYRPKNFDELIGQKHIKKILTNSIIDNKIAHAYIFTGPRGTGKTSTAKIFAKAINCLNSKNGISCEECESCINFDQTPDIIEMDAASNNGVENIRDIIENIGIAPTSSKYKIYIIDEVHMLSTQAWNAFLKTLEEPPTNVIFILATTDIQKVPITVLSRCQRYDFQRIDREEIVENLSNICHKENVKFTLEALEEISYLSDGCMRDALSILDQISKVAPEITLEEIKNNYGTVTNEEIDQIYSNIIHNDIDSLITNILNVKKTGIDIKVLIDKILDNFLEKAIAMKKRNLSNNIFNQLKNIIDSLNKLTNKIASNSNGYLMLQLELIAFINNEENLISNREIKQIISREIISEEVDIDKLVSPKREEYYNITSDFIDARINNAFVGASKEAKKEFSELWKNFKSYIIENSINEYKTIINNVIPQVVSKNNILFVTKNDSTKIVANSKIHLIELKFKELYKIDKKIIFITDAEWKKVFSSFSENKDLYKEFKDDTEFIIKEDTAIKLAESIFGDNNINIE